MDQAFEYIIKNKGIDCEFFYPYIARVSHWTSPRMTIIFSPFCRTGLDMPLFWVFEGCHYVRLQVPCFRE